MTAGLLDGQVALVTGASGGLGRHFGLTLAGAGCAVAPAARRQKEVTAVADEICALGVSSHPAMMDVANAASVAAALDEIEDRLGPVSIVVNNAGIAIDKKIGDTTEEDWDRVVDTNLKGAWLVAREAAGRMAAAGTKGVIINIASILGVTATQRVHAYSASKAALIQLTRTMAVELGRDGIRVNALAPGYVETDINRELLSGPIGERLVKRVPLRRFAQPQDLNGALLLLAGPGGAYMTGSVITVDGGMTLSAL